MPIDYDEFGDPIEVADDGYAELPMDEEDGGGFLRTQLGGLAGRLGAGSRVGPSAGGAISGAARMIGNLVYSAAGRVRGIVSRAGQFFSSAKVADLAQRFGLEVAAAGLGVTLVEVAQAVFSHHAHRRRKRGRGITARDMRTSRRTIRTLTRMHHTLAILAAQGVRHSRRAARFGAPGAGVQITQAR